MKAIINACLALAMLGAAYWTVQNVVLSPSAAPIGGTPDPSIEDHQGEINTFRESR